MEFTKRFLRAKSPCADGFRWFSRNVQDGAGYQQALDTLVAAGRVDDACWLLDQFGPTNEVLTLDTLDAEALVFAGTLVVRGAIAADRLRVGRALRAGAGLRIDGAPATGTGTDSRISLISAFSAFFEPHRLGSRMIRWLNAGAANSLTSSGRT